MADQLYMVNPQSPVGLGPFAPVSQGQELAMTPESLRMKIYEELLKKQAQQQPQAQEQQAPLDKMQNRMGSRPFTGTYLTDKTNPANAGMPILKNEFAESSPQEVATKPAAQGQAPVEQSPEQTATPEAAQEIQKAVQEVVKSPEDERLLNNAINRPTEDGTQSIAQRIAMIAMAVAPTAVGMALGGKKGAYIGGKATGDGLTAGTETYMKEEAAGRAERKLDIEAKKAERAARNSPDKVNPREPNEYGQMGTIGSDNVWRPVTDSRGNPVFKSNEPVQGYSPDQGVTFKRPFKPRENQTPSSPITPPQQPAAPMATQPKTTAPIAQPIKRQKAGELVEKIRGAWKKEGAEDIPGAIPSFANNPDFVLGSTGEESGFSREEAATASADARRWEREQNKLIQDYKASKNKQGFIANQKELDRKARERAAKIVADREGDKRFEKNVADLQTVHYKPMVELNSRFDFYLNDFDRLSSQMITDPMTWQKYLKTIQDDSSVVRPGENEMAMQFIPVSEKIKMFLNSKVKMDSIMTASLRTDVLNMFADMKRVRMSRFADAVNEYYKEAKSQGKEDVLRQRLSPEAKSMVNDLYRDGIRKAPVLSIVDYKKLYDSDKLKNGFFFKDPTGKMYMFKDQKYDRDGKITSRGRVTEWEVPNE